MSDRLQKIPSFSEVMTPNTSNGKIPSFADIMGEEVKKKEEVTPSKSSMPSLSASATVGEGVSTGTENTAPSTSQLPLDAKGIFEFGNQRTSKKGAIPANIPRTAVEVNTVLAKVENGVVQKEELSELYQQDYGKPIVENLINIYAPELGKFGWDKEVFRNEEKWDELSKKIKAKNRTNGNIRREEAIKNIDASLQEAVSNLKTTKVTVTGGTGGAAVNENTLPLPVFDVNNPWEYGRVIEQLKNAEDVVDANGNRIPGKKDELIEALDIKAKWFTAKQGVDENVLAMNDKITTAITKANMNRELGESISTEEFAINDKVNEEHFKLGLSHIKNVQPGRYKNIVRVIEEGKSIPDDDFRDLSNVGQQIYNQQIFEKSATNPELIDKETDFDYTTRSDKKAQYAAIIGERLKASGRTNRREFSEAEIKKAGADLQNKSIVQELANEEKIFGYDAIPKSGAIESVVQGIMQPLDGIKSTFLLATESPAETYIRSKKLDTGSGQKVVDEEGQVSGVLPSDRGNVFYDALRGFGQFIPQVLLTKGIGGAATSVIGADARIALTPALKSGISAYGGTAISTFLQTYGDSYADYLQKTGDHATARLGGGIDAVSSAAFELLLPDVKIADRAMAGFRQTLSTDLIDLVKKGGDPATLAKNGRGFVEKFVKNTLNITGQEVAEEVGTQVVDFITESVFSPQTSKDRDLGSEILETVKATAISMAIPSLLGAAGGSVNQDFTKDAFTSAAINFDDYRQALDKQLNNDAIDQTDYNAAIKLLTTHRESINAAPQQNINGVTIDGQKQLDYAYEDTKIKVYQEKAKESTGVAKEMWENKIKQSEDIQREILMPKVVEEKELTPEEIKAAKLLATANLPGVYDEMAEENPVGVLQEISQQAQGIDKDGNPLEGGSRKQDLLDNGVPEKVIDEAIKLFPVSKAAIQEGAAENVVPSTLKDVETHESVMGRAKTGESIEINALRIQKSDDVNDKGGVFFGDKGVIEEYKSREKSGFYGEKNKGRFAGDVKEYSISFKNPLVVQSQEQFIKQLAESGDKDAQNVMPNYKESDIAKLETTHKTHEEFDEFVANKAREKGYDGIILPLEYIALGNNTFKQKSSPTNEAKTVNVVPAPLKEDTISVNELLDKPITRNGHRGTLFQDGQTIVFKPEGVNREYELGNVNEIGNASIKEFGLEQEQSVVGVSDAGDISVRGNVYKNNYSDPTQAINRNNAGDVISVTLDTEDGKKRTFRGNIAEDIAYQISLKEITKDNETETQFEQFVESDEDSKQAILSVENAVATETETIADNEEIQRVPIERQQIITTQQTTTQNEIQQPTTSAQSTAVNEPANAENAPAGQTGNTATTPAQPVQNTKEKPTVKSLTEELRALLGNESAALTGDANPKNRISFKDLGITETDTTEQAIDKLIDHGGEFTEILKAIKADPNFKNIKVQLVDSRSGLENGESGLYFPVGYGEGMDNTLQIANKDNVYYTATHELLHFLTLDGATANELKGTQSYQALTDMYNYIADKKGKPVAIAGGATVESYGLTNEKEFMAELLINPTFRKYVSDVFAANKNDIFKTSKAVRDSKVNSIGDIIYNFFKDIFDKLFSSPATNIPFDEKQSVVDNAARLATQLFFGGENVIVGQTDSGQGATVLGMGSQNQRTAALALPSLRMTEFEKEEMLSIIDLRRDVVKDDPESADGLEKTDGGLDILEEKIKSGDYNFSKEELDWLKKEALDFNERIKAAADVNDIEDRKAAAADLPKIRNFISKIDKAIKSPLALPGINRDDIINSFVKSALDRGENESDIKESLINNGISESDAQSFIDSNKPKPKTKQVSTKSENEIISTVLNQRIDARSFPTIFQDNETGQQIAAGTQGAGQGREVDGAYVVALEKDLREVSIQSAHVLRNELGADWGEKTLSWIEQNPSQGNIAQVVGLLNIISTENYQDIKNTHDGNRVRKLFAIQRRIDVVSMQRARDASLALRQRILYAKFAQGGNMADAVANSILSPEVQQMQADIAEVLSQQVTDEEINSAPPLKTNKPKKESAIRNIMGSAKRKSNPAIKDELISKGAETANKTKKTFKELIEDAKNKLNNVKC